MGHYRKHCISFLMSSTCNLDCTYCYIPHWGNTVEPCDRTIDLEFAVAGMKEFFAWAPKPAIRFFAAGEPTVGFTRMTEIVEEGRKLVGDRLQVELQSNGFLMAKSRIGWSRTSICSGSPVTARPNSRMRSARR